MRFFCTSSRQEMNNSFGDEPTPAAPAHINWFNAREMPPHTFVEIIPLELMRVICLVWRKGQSEDIRFRKCMRLF